MRGRFLQPQPEPMLGSYCQDGNREALAQLDRVLARLS